MVRTILDTVLCDWAEICNGSHFLDPLPPLGLNQTLKTFKLQSEFDLRETWLREWFFPLKFEDET